MRAIYVRRSNPGSWLLRTALWSSWSHCAIVTPQDTVIEAAAFHGVQEVTLASFVAGVSDHSLKDIALPDDAAAIQWAREQIGKPYDWWGAIGLALHREWNEDDSWFCSELVEGAAAAGGRQRFVQQAKRVTPQHSWMVA
jgi:uncharacterized protein YycO